MEQITNVPARGERVCCKTAEHGVGCSCWRCVCLTLTDELEAVESAPALLPEVKPAVRPKPKLQREAPQVTLDALIYCYRTRGQASFDEPMNRVRLADLSPRQRDDLRERIARVRRLVPA